jgi:hypothetical protein
MDLDQVETVTEIEAPNDFEGFFRDEYPRLVKALYLMVADLPRPRSSPKMVAGWLPDRLRPANRATEIRPEPRDHQGGRQRSADRGETPPRGHDRLEPCRITEAASLVEEPLSGLQVPFRFVARAGFEPATSGL